MSTAGLIARGVSVQVAGRLAAVVVSLVTLAMTTRYLGAEGYGLLITVVLFTGVFQAFTDLEIGTVIVRRVGGGAGDLRRLVGVNLGASLGYAAPLAITTIAFSLLLYPGEREVHQGVAILSVGLGLTVISSCFRPPYELAIRFEALAVSDIVSRAMALALTLAIVEFDLGITAVFVVQIVPNLVELIMLTILSRRYGPFRPVFDLATTVGLFREALPLAMVNLIGILYFRADGVLLSMLSEAEQVGAYGLGYRVAGNLGIVSMAFLSSVLATMVRSYAVGREPFARTVTTSLEFMLVFAVPTATLGLLVAEPVLRVLAGESLAELAVAPTQALLVATALGFLNATAGQALVTSHRQRALLIISASALTANLILNMVLIPRYAAVGAGLALIATEAWSLVASQALLFRSARVTPPIRYVLRLLPAVVAGAGAWYLTRDSGALIELPAVALAYFGGLLLFGPVRVADIRRITSRGAGEPEPEPGEEPEPGAPSPGEPQPIDERDPR